MTIDTMRRRGLVAVASMALAAVAAVLPTMAPAQGTGPSRAVFQVSDADPQKWGLVLNNVRNAAEDLGAGSEIEIVAFGPGIGMLKGDSPVAARIAEALKGGVRIVACENTMRAFHLSRGDMLPDIGYVPAGVGEIIRKQREGWAYLRP